MSDLLEKHGFHFQKKYGQNFLQDTKFRDALPPNAPIMPCRTALRTAQKRFRHSFSKSVPVPAF